VAYVTDAEVKTYFAAHLGLLSEDDTDAKYDVLIPRANSAAYNLIRGKLLQRGFTAAQVAAWDQGAEFNLDLACCYLMRTAAQTTESDLWQQKFCRKDELEDIPVMIDGEIIDPTTSTGSIGYGDMSRTDDEFSRDTEW